jgi:restriction endonuclease S subunit
MREGWRTVPLAELTERRTDFTKVDGDQSYEVVGVQRSGIGLVHRPAVPGDSMKFTKLMRLEEGDLVLRTITAFEAPSTVVGADSAGAFVTPQTFPVFRINSDLALPQFIRLLTTLESFHEAMAERSVGTVLRRKTLSAAAFQSIPIQLPPLPEQHRIVDLVRAVDDAIEAADRVQTSTAETLAEILRAILDSHSRTYELQALSRVLELDAGKVTVEPDTEYPIAGVLNRGRGLLLREAILGAETSYSTLHVIRPGQVIYSKLKAFEGAITVSPADLDERYASGEFPTFDCSESLLPEYFRLITLRPEFWAKLATLSKGMGGRRERMAPADFLSIELSIPPRSVQEESVALAVTAEEQVRSAADFATSLRSLRSNLLTALLSGEHEIPVSYDALLEGAA